MDADLAVGLAIDRPLVQSVAVPESSKDLLYPLLAGISIDEVAGAPVQTVGQPARKYFPVCQKGKGSA